MTIDASPRLSFSQARRRLSNVDQNPDARRGLPQQGKPKNLLRDALSHEHVRPRQLPDLESAVGQVVQTVSVAVVQVVDSTGAVVDVQTVLPGQAVSTSAAPALDLTVDAASFLDSLVPTVPALDSLIATVLPIPITPDVPSTQTTPTEPQPTADPNAVTTTPPVTTSAPFPTSSGLFNSTRPAFFGNGTTLRTFFANTSTTSTSSSTDIFANLFTTDASSPETLTDAPSATDVGSDNGKDGPIPTLTVLPTTTSASTATPTPAGLTPTQTYVVSGLVGGIAGIAIVALALMFLIKWKRRQGQGLRLLGDGDGASGMRERSTTLFAMPATLTARHAAQREKQPARMIEAGAHSGDRQPSNERSFYRVSGRKLTSVLQSGGDGYSDPVPPSRPPRSPLVLQQPRDSANPFTDPPYEQHHSIDPFSDDDGVSSRVVSGSSFYNYRDSMAAFSGPHSPPLQLGSPMRPESGIMTMRSGPARTPVHEQAPISYFHEDEDTPVTPPVREPYGRSVTPHASQPHDSPSRFSENL